jgi:GNAT superfamily N-acetyltransferase
MVTLRAMTDPDVPAVVRAWDQAFQAMCARYGLAFTPMTAENDLRLGTRIRHFLSTDPGGSWVADDAGVIVGLSQSFVRQSYWVLSLLATLPGFQGRGLGRELLQLALNNAEPDGPGTIQSSRDPAAMALYTSAGFSLHPVVNGHGTVRSGTVNADPRVRHSDDRELELVDAIDRAVRSGARTVDIVAMLQEPGARLLLMSDRGYAVVKDDRVVTLGARDEDAAAALLETFLAETGEDKMVEVMWLTARQQWAIGVLVAAGVELRPYGAVMVRNLPGLPATYIPSGGYG